MRYLVKFAWEFKKYISSIFSYFYSVYCQTASKLRYNIYFIPREAYYNLERILTNIHIDVLDRDTQHWVRAQYI